MDRQKSNPKSEIRNPKQFPNSNDQNPKQALVRLGPVEKIPLGQGFCFIVEQEEIAVFRPRAGGLHAIQHRCPHRRGPLAEGVCDSLKVICPYHGHQFDLATGLGSEAAEKVKVYEVFEKDGEIVLKRT